MLLGQSVEQARASKREEGRFWSWSDDDYRIVEVSAFAGPTSTQDGYWWVPELGFSGGEGYHLFKTKVEAARAAYTKISKDITRLERLRANIDAP
jgi:hypothetical protein